MARIPAVSALLEPRMLQLLVAGLTSAQELQKIPEATMPQHRQDLVIKQAHIKDEQAEQE